MRIALACPYAWDMPGGVQVHVRQLADHLRSRGHDVLVLAPAREDREAGDHVAVIGRAVRISINGSVAPVCLSLSSARRIADRLREFDPDVVHAHEPLFPGTGLFAARAARAPVVGTFHAYAERAPLYSLIAPVVAPVWRRLAAKIAVSRAAAGFVASRFRGDGIEIIPNGAEVETFARATPAELPEGRPILFVNRLEPRKGFAVLVDAFPHVLAEVSDALLVVCGDGAERTAVRRLDADVRQHVVMAGRVSHADLPGYHAAAEIFCAPATGNESFGIVLVEAMAAGLPVVASDIAGYREVVRDGREGVLVPPRDPRRLADAIVGLLRDPGRGKELGDAGRERARRYAWDEVAGEVETVYRRAIGER